MPRDVPGGSGVTRRSFIQTLGVSAAATALADQASAAAEAQPGAGGGPALLGPDPIDLTLRVNGKESTIKVDPATTLLDALRLHLNLTGTKTICDRGSCGGCSVLMDGKLINSCMLLAVDAVGAEVTTIEGLAPAAGENGERLDPIQQAFIKHDALQCGYCTPGLVMATRWLLNEAPKPTLDQIKHYLAGNLCRCGTYTNVFNAALEASGQPVVADSKGA
jgi:aerobic-type carbon monoxide dehydrogenase small subunit (CoxS/CutS family)